MERLDQDIYFTPGSELTGKPVRYRLRLDTTYPGQEDMFLIVPVEPVDRKAFENAIQNLSRKLDGKRDRYPEIHKNLDGPGMRLIILMRPREECLRVTEGIFASLPDWSGDDFDFCGSVGLIELLLDLQEVFPGIDFLRGNGSKINIPLLP